MFVIGATSHVRIRISTTSHYTRAMKSKVHMIKSISPLHTHYSAKKKKQHTRGIITLEYCFVYSCYTLEYCSVYSCIPWNTALFTLVYPGILLCLLLYTISNIKSKVCVEKGKLGAVYSPQ